MTFRVGQKVVCVDDEFLSECWHPRWMPHLPRNGRVYTIRSLYIEPWRSGDDPAILVNEITNPSAYWPDNDGSRTYRELGFAPYRFRPVVEKKTDISIFTAMLNTKQHENVCGND